MRFATDLLCPEKFYVRSSRSFNQAHRSVVRKIAAVFEIQDIYTDAGAQRARPGHVLTEAAGLTETCDANNKLFLSHTLHAGAVYTLRDKSPRLNSGVYLIRF